MIGDLQTMEELNTDGSMCTPMVMDGTIQMSHVAFMSGATTNNYFFTRPTLSGDFFCLYPNI